MNFKFLVVIFLFLLTFSMHSQVSAKAKKLLKKNHLEFILPEGFAELTGVPNEEMDYDFAFQHGLDTFEVRYSIFPLGPKLKEFKRNLKNPAIKVIHPNFYWVEKYNENIRKLSKLDKSEVPIGRQISENAMNEEFNADAGAVTYFDIKSIYFAPEFDYCLMMVLHKNFEADVYISFLGNNRETIEIMALKMFHAIRFKA